MKIFAAIALGIFTIAVANPARADVKDELERFGRRLVTVTGCVVKVENASCKYITVGPNTYSANVRSELPGWIVFFTPTFIAPNLKTIPTDKEVVIDGLTTGLPSATCAGAQGMFVRAYRSTGKKCPK